MDTGLDGKVAIVTGGSGGIGLACARALVAEGARVVLGDLNAEAAAASAAELGADAAVSAAVDVTRPDDAQRLVDVALERFGRLDVLVASAGVHRNTRLDEVSPEEWDLLLAVNLRGVFLTAQAALRVFVPQRSGRIVALASLASQTGGLAASAAYAASKGGVVTLTKSLARYAGPHNVTANCVNPGIIDSPMTAGWSPEDLARLTANTPLGRLGTTDEVAAAVVFLASDAASFVTGTHIDVNGGILMD
ncbi:MAG: 3-oxoacyl-[acyl-carrier protein] reductase [Gaiellales bacterium]|jgi:3-oxoacyl-[acyl-carrier protein] reductase|nr:3-oxoacyl-[acyl-carrier protein] reductase [Gaiellales bacterium]MDX6598610.1 3-oxoacyl-[acyl-carrier protein] reductase [Gaiellales bacterium]